MPKYTRRKMDQGFERRFIIGLIVSDRFIREAKQIYKPEYISAQSVATVAEWCFNYYDEYEKAPQQHIQDIFDTKQYQTEDALLTFIEGLLEQLSDEWEHAEKFNVDFLLDEAEKHFKAKSLLALSADLRELATSGSLEEAEELHARYMAPQRHKGIGVNTLTDTDLIERSLLESEEEPLFKFAGALGEVLNPQLYRSTLIGLQGPEKCGKTFWLDEILFRAFRCRCNVARFDLGDMTEEQRTVRDHCFLAMKPSKRFYKKGKPIRVPVMDCARNQDNSCTYEDRICKVGVLIGENTYLPISEAERVGYKPCTRCKQGEGAVWYKMVMEEPVSIADAIINGQKYFSRGKGKHFRTSCHETKSLNIKGIRNILEKWRNLDGFVADVIGIDYPGIAAPEDSRQDQRNRVNDTWAAMRALSQHYKACVIAVDQTDAESYGKDTIKLKHFTEDKRKYGHVTAMYGINRTDADVEKGVTRINELLIREGAPIRGRQVKVLECRSIGRVNLGSYF